MMIAEPMLTTDLEDDPESATTEWGAKMLRALAGQLGVGNDFYFPLLGIARHLELGDAEPLPPIVQTRPEA